MAKGHVVVFTGEHADAGKAAEIALAAFGEWDQQQGNAHLTVEQISTNLVLRQGEEPTFVYMITVLLSARGR